MNIGFWNIRKKNLKDLLISLTRENEVNILCLAEADTDDVDDFIIHLNAVIQVSNPSRAYRKIKSVKSKVTIISDIPEICFQDKSALYNSTRLVAQRLVIPNYIELNIVSIHFHSKREWKTESLAMECAIVANAIYEIEKKRENEEECKNTIVIGDFNMNPFEYGMIAANGLHAIPDLEHAKRNINREIDDSYYPFFYNPMWNFFGDHKEPYGTYFYPLSTNVSYGWQMYDQILLRPSLKEFLEKEDEKKYVEIITKIGGQSLLTNIKRPDVKLYSDHLPIIIKLKQI